MDARSTEGRARIEAARRVMAAEGMDGLLLVSGPNATYLSGYPSFERTARAIYVVLPRRGPVVAVAHAWRAEEARRYAWVDEVRTYERLGMAPLAELESVWRDLQLRGGRVGAELAGELRMGIPYAEFEALRERLDDTRFEDASDVLWRLRMVKSATEIARHRRACQVTALAYAATFAGASAGTPGSEIVNNMKIEMMRRGGAEPWVMASFGPGHYDMPSEVVEDRPVEPGDLLWMDAGCTVEGYWSDFSRAAVVGPASSRQRDAQRAVHEVTAAAVRMIRPGLPVAELAAVCAEGVARLGLPVTTALSDRAQRIGHGLGLDVTEMPHIAAYDPTVLAAGMVVTVEPAVATADGAFHVEENVVVTVDGHEVLSATAPWELVEV